MTSGDKESRVTRRAERDAAERHSQKGLSERDLTALDRSYEPASESETEELQREPIGASAAIDDDIDQAEILVLPGTGGPDDDGDVEVDPAELNLSGDSIPGHPKPPSHPH